MSVPTTFKAAILPEQGARHVIVDRSLPDLASGEIAIRITATAINPVDWKMRDTGVFIPEYPAIFGSDAAGTVAAVGPDVSDFQPGDRVFFQGILGVYDSCTFQQYCKMPAVLVSKTPKNVSDDQAAGVQLALIAALVALYDKTGYGLPAPWDEGGNQVGKGKAIAIIGGSSSVGQYAIQLAKLSGFDRIITNASPTHIEHLKGLGAHVVLDRTTQSTPEDFHNALDGLALPIVIDAISATSTVLLSLKTLQLAASPGATLVRIAGDKEDLVSLVSGGDGIVASEVTELNRPGRHPVHIKGILGVGSASHLRYLSEPLAKHLGGEDGYVAKGLIVPNRPVVVPGGLAALDLALEKNKKGVSGEKVIIHPFE